MFTHPNKICRKLISDKKEPIVVIRMVLALGFHRKVDFLMSTHGLYFAVHPIKTTSTPTTKTPTTFTTIKTTTTTKATTSKAITTSAAITKTKAQPTTRPKPTHKKPIT